MNFIIVVVLAVAIALLLPIWYSATTVILPPSGGSGSLPSFLPADLKGVATSFGFDTASEEIYQTILSSRTILERIVERFDLRQVYKMDDDDFIEDVLEAFLGHMEVNTHDDGSIGIKIEDRSAQRAADMANACVEELDRIFSGITSETARKNKLFIGKRLAQMNDSLAMLQESLRHFQEVNNAISIPDQLMAMIRAGADLKAEQLANKVELDVMQSSFGSDHPLVKQLKLTNDAYEEKFQNLIDGKEGDIFLSIRELPALGQEFAEIMQKVRIQAALIEYIYPQYESANLTELRETANVQVLDRAVKPNRKSRPPRKLIVILSAMASVIGTLVLVLILEYWRNLRTKNEDDWSKVESIRKLLRGN